MQEPDGGRREDRVKAWGWWNAYGYGTHYSLVQYLGMGQAIAPAQALPGDFVNISWKSGLGHSVVFLGYSRDEVGALRVSFFSRQASTNWLTIPYRPVPSRTSCLCALTHPERIWDFSLDSRVDTGVAGDLLPE
ncbi:hypothetical protein IV102_37320 [bacterium]|nr:hypothetical protein [bacterium]